MIFNFAYLIDKIDNIIKYSPYGPCYVTRTSANGSAVYWSRDFRLYHATIILHCLDWTMWILCNYIINYIY